VVGLIAQGQERYYIGTMVDQFTRFAEAAVVTSLCVVIIWQAVYVRWIAALGCPTYLLTDNATCFTSGYFN